MAESSEWVIEIRTPKMPKPMKVLLDQPLIIGRVVAGDTKKVDIDLASYGAEELGVSRQHLALFTEGDRLMVRDLESGNGTFINGRQLTANEDYRIGHDDTIQLGRLPVEVRVIVSPSHGSGVHKQPSLQLQDQMHDGKGQLVLIVEDDPEVAKAFALILEKAGYTTRVSHEVVAAIRMFNQRRPSAVLLDLMLPDMNGLEFCRYVRRDVLLNSVPIIVVSAAKSAMNVAEAMQAGADIFLDKPVSAKELRHVVSALIHAHESGVGMMSTKHLVGTAPLKAMPPESRRNSAVIFIAGHSDKPITLNVQQPVSFGRAPETGSLSGKAHIDLGKYDAVNFGVSRVHLFLHYENGEFFAEDADSINGTFINGESAQPHQKIRVNNADEIRLGQLRMYIYFLEDKDIAAE